MARTSGHQAPDHPLLVLFEPSEGMSMQALVGESHCVIQRCLADQTGREYYAITATPRADRAH
eukprot:8600944-Pyramimonas_sp.AAC.1